MSALRPAQAAAFALLLLAWSCGREAARTPAPAPPSPPSTPPPQAAPWTWHKLGGLAVVEGEVQAPTELILEGPSIRLTCYAEPGPVHWEMYLPPEGEVATLHTASGRILAQFVFSTRPQPAPPPALPSSPPRAKPAQAPAPVTRPRPPVAPPPPVPLPAPAVRTRPQAQPAPARPLPLRGAPPAWHPEAHPAPLPLRKAWTPLRPPAPPPPRPTLPPAPSEGVLWPGMGEGFNLVRGPRNRKQILLSFDGGSGDEVATEILDLLKAKGIHTTFFLTGRFIQHYPDIVRRMVAEGHEVGDHTMDHPHFAPGMRRDPAWTKARIQKELLEADAAFLRVTGRPMAPYWRAPYGEETPQIRRWAEEVGYRHVGWSEGADSLDWATRTTRGLYHPGPAIIARLERRLDHDADGLIVLMHLGSGRPAADRPAEELGAFIDRARAEGFTFVNAGTFFRELGKPVWDPRKRLALLEPSGPARLAGPR